MTPQEAIDFIECEVQIDVRFCSDKKVDKTIEVFELAISALEKQVEKKPKAHIVDVEKLKIGNANWCKGTTVYRCPNCNDFISRIYDFCYKCGQALDWSDNNV